MSLIVMKLIVLGAGMVGSVIARDLNNDKNIEVTVADIDEEKLNFLENKYQIKGIKTDLTQTEKLKDLVKNFDLVIGAVPGFMGYKTIKTVIEAGKNVVDISFFPEDPFDLNELALQNDVTAVIDAGVAPGLSNIILGHVDSILDDTNNFICYVGGLPLIRKWPYEYKAPFSPIDVIEEYTRVARYVENGKIVMKAALSEPELLNFKGIGTLEAFSTDGLRTLIKTMPNVKNMKEKTLRYPGHIEKMKMLLETGFFSDEEIEVKGVKIRPIDLTTKLLFNEWKFDEKEEDITVMEIIVEGIKEGNVVQYDYYLLDHYDKEQNISSMSRTTGYTCSNIARLLINGIYSKKGLITPEEIGQNEEAFNSLIKQLEERNIRFNVDKRVLPISKR